MATVAAWGLFVAFVVHDAEEWVTLPGWLGRNAERLKRIHPRIPSSAASTCERTSGTSLLKPALIMRTANATEPLRISDSP